MFAWLDAGWMKVYENSCGCGRRHLMYRVRWRLCGKLFQLVCHAAARLELWNGAGRWRPLLAFGPAVFLGLEFPFTNKWRAFRQPQSRVFLRLFEFLPSWQQQLYAARKLEATTNTEFCLTADMAIASAEIADGNGDAGSIHTHSEKCPTRKTNIPKSNILFDLYAHFSHSAVVVTDTSQR